MIGTKDRLEAAGRAVVGAPQPTLQPDRRGGRAWIAAGAALLGAGLAVAIVVATTSGRAPARHGSVRLAGEHITSTRPFSDGTLSSIAGASQVVSTRPFSDGSYNPLAGG